MRWRRAPTTPGAAASPNGWPVGACAREAAVKRRAAASANTGVSGALSPAFLFATLNGKLSQDDIVVNEAIRNAPILQEHVTRTRPRSYVGLAGGGLGFSGGMALGLKLAQPDRRIVQVIGDGGFHFSSPDSVYAVAQQYRIPILTVVLDNGGWQAVKSAVQRVYPKGIAAETDQFQSRLTSGRQGETRDFSAVAKAFGAHGECVTRTGRSCGFDRPLPGRAGRRQGRRAARSRHAALKRFSPDGKSNLDEDSLQILPDWRVSRTDGPRRDHGRRRVAPRKTHRSTRREPFTLSSASRRAAATTLSRGLSDRNCLKASANPSSSTTSRAAARLSPPNTSPNRHRMATRCWSDPAAWPSIPPSTTNCLTTSIRDFVAVSELDVVSTDPDRQRGVADQVGGRARRSREGQSGQDELCLLIRRVPARNRTVQAEDRRTDAGHPLQGRQRVR